MSSCAVPAHRASLLPASMLQTLFGHRQASWGHGTLWTLTRALRQADRQAACRAIGTVTAKDKRISPKGTNLSELSKTVQADVCLDVLFLSIEMNYQFICLIV